jgi:hypothetical protein
MRDRQFSYAIKGFEAQWDRHHDESVKPFFEQLRRDTRNIDARQRRRGKRKKYAAHDALLSYSVFQNAEGLRAELDRMDRGVGPRAKIGYFACHGLPNKICAVEDISRTKLKNILGQRSGYDGFLFGACDFVDRDTATQLLNAAPYCKWVAGYARWTPWLESMVCDLMFFRLLLTGRFFRPQANARWDRVPTPQAAAMALYEDFTPSVALRFSLFYRAAGRIGSTLEEYENTAGETADGS